MSYSMSIHPRIAISKPVFVTDYGAFEIPADVPYRELRKDGWFDRRKRASKELRAYYAAMTERVKNGEPVLTWAEWTNLTSPRKSV